MAGCDCDCAENMDSTTFPEELEPLLTKLESEGYASVPAVKVYQAANPFMLTFNIESDIFILDRFCRYLNWSLDQENPEHSYIASGFQKEHLVNWIEHIKLVAVKCLLSMTHLKPDLQSDSKSLSVFLSTIVSLTSMRNWRITKLEGYKTLENGINKLTNNVFAHMISEGDFFENINTILQLGYTRPGKISLTKTNLYAITTLAVRPVLDPLFCSDLILFSYVAKIFAIPGYVHFVHSVCPESLPDSLYPKLIEFFFVNAGIDNCLGSKDISFMVSLLANIVDFGQYYPDLKEILFPKLITILVKLSKYCEIELNASKKSHWHPLLGWVSAPIPLPYLYTVDIVRGQLETLWKPVYVKACFYPLFDCVESLPISELSRPLQFVPSPTKASFWKTGWVKFVKKIFPGDSRRRSSTSSKGMSVFCEISEHIAKSCCVYNNLIASLTPCRVDILTGLCFKESSILLISLWKFLQELNPDQTVKVWVDILVNYHEVQESTMLLFSEAMAHFITVLDDQEMYEEQKAFSLDNLADIAYFMNNLCYRILVDPNYARVRNASWNAIKTLLMLLYRRDSRRQFCPDGLWLVESGKMNQLISDIDKGRKTGKKVLLELPHVIKEEARVIFFRKWATSEKTKCTHNPLEDFSLLNHVISPSTSSTMQPLASLITVHRGRIVEDGYAQLANLSPIRLKGTIRVRFQNELGLDEAGIDQDGVFKEFLEETISRVFSPSLNLFKATSENLLYPSPLSYLHENHLELFEFVGRMLGKAVFEGIVVDVHFAPFFVTQMLGLQQNGLMFSVIDELQSFDRELYSSLIYMKHYEGDVKELELTFSIDQEVFGRVENVELIPGGRTIPVTNENRISYIYLKAHYHLCAQIKEQTGAFLRGFRSIISNEWLRIFSPPELQRLISGEDSLIDLGDLRRHTQYYGGFHDGHRVIAWLWDILEHDFTEEERRLFLKFVTSCSKPPLLGFSNLEPPFSVRCVEVSDDDDTGDTIGSVLRGFLTLGKQEPTGRLPTSSTCFNLLKLPNYNKKATLREKLRYAITSNVGFELS